MSNYCRHCQNFPGIGNSCYISFKIMTVTTNAACGNFVKKTNDPEVTRREPVFPETNNLEIIKTGPAGQIQVICQQPKGTPEAINFVMAVDTLKAVDKKECPYSYRYVK